MAPLERLSQAGNRGQIGYFCYLQLDEKHMGAILVTNQIGVPLEFRYTEPVTATPLHKILYGSVLDKYLHETVIRDRLANEVRSGAEFFVTPYEEKEYLGPLAGKEMLAAQRVNVAHGELTGSFTRIREREALVQLEDGVALRLAFSTSDDSVQHEMVNWLQEMGRTMDVLEPLDRVRCALASICGNGKKG